MTRLVAALLVVAALGGCGGSKQAQTTTGGKPPLYAYLTDVRVQAAAVRFDFRSPPRQVVARYVPRASVVGCGSGLPLALRGSAFVVVSFQPAMTAVITDGKVVPTYEGANRLRGTGPVLELVKSCDFEADVSWAIGLERRLPLHVSQDGSSVTVRFG